MPSLFIITGSNGAGKSTVGATYLPETIQEKYTVFDGDKLALQKRRDLFPVITKSLKEARKLADDWVFELFIQKYKSALKSNDHFAYEAHFRDERTLNIPRQFKRKGYEVNLIFMGLSDINLSELRVIDRAKQGGHNVPMYEIQSNFYGNLFTLNKHYKLFDGVLVIDTSGSLEHKILLQLRKSEILSYTPSKYQPLWFIKFLPNLLKLIKQIEKKK